MFGDYYKEGRDQFEIISYNFCFLNLNDVVRKYKSTTSFLICFEFKGGAYSREQLH